MKWRGTSTDTAGLKQGPRLLQQRLLEVRAGIAQYVRPENQQINQRAIEWLKNAGIVERALKVGETAPGFQLLDQSGQEVCSAELLSRGPLVISFFRGRWCPFCVAELEAWRDALPLVRDAGASLVAVSPQKVQHNSFTADQHKLFFPVLSDARNQLARAFGIVYRVREEQELLFRRSFVNLPHLNGDESWELPLPATFTIGSDGYLRSAFASPDYRERAEPANVLLQLQP